MFIKASPDHGLWLIISMLTTWRLTTLVCYEAGPFNMLTKFRLLLYKIKLGSLVDCFHCTALWISILTGFSVYELNIALPFLILAIAGGTSILEKALLNFSTSKQQIENEND